MDFELEPRFLSKFESQKSRIFWYIMLANANTPLHQTEQRVFQTEIKVLLLNLVDMHAPSPKIKEYIEFQKVLNVKQFLKNSWKWLWEQSDFLGRL
jgi:hypothetical protein